MFLKNFHHPNLVVEEFNSFPGESWCIFGSNNSGIEIFLTLIQGDLEHYSAEEIELPDSPAVISFARQQELFESELRNDDTDFLGTQDPGTLVREFLPTYREHTSLLHALAMDHCLDLGYRQLSSGQCRKLLLLRAFMEGAQILILQNPYDGLDESSCFELDQSLILLAKQSVSIFLFVNVVNDIPDWCSHLALIENNRITHTGKSELILPLCKKTSSKTDILPAKSAHDVVVSLEKSPMQQNQGAFELVVLKQGFAKYGNRVIFSGLDLWIHTGDHTLICGPNGCGKSTLLDIITGDNQNCYCNDLHIFGKKRGSGETIWQLKQEMGIISPTLHRDHRSVGTALHVVLSGLFDTIGLYRHPHSQDIIEARKWLYWIGFPDAENKPFSRLTFAQQRLVLIARALVKKPRLLILDEPTQGLDDHNRELLLSILARITDDGLSTIVYVSHRRDEHKDFFKQQIHLDSFAT